MRTFIRALAGATLALSVSFAFAQASALTTDQVNAILNLLQSFGASQSIINNVQLSLTGGTPSVTNTNNSGDNNNGNNGANSGGEDNGNGNWHSIVPGWMGSTTSIIGGEGENNGQQQGPAACLTFNRDLGEGDQGGDVMGLQQMLKDDGLFTASTTGFFGPVTAHALAMWQEQNGIASSTQGGAVGPLTRGFFERRCGPGEGDNGRGNGGIPGMGGVMGSTTDNAPMIPALPPPPVTTTASTSQE